MGIIFILIVEMRKSAQRGEVTCPSPKRMWFASKPDWVSCVNVCMWVCVRMGVNGVSVHHVREHRGHVPGPMPAENCRAALTVRFGHMLARSQMFGDEGGGKGPVSAELSFAGGAHCALSGGYGAILSITGWGAGGGT